MAYFCVQLRADDSYLVLSVLHIWAISGTRGSSGFGSVSNEHMESNTCKIQRNTRSESKSFSVCLDFLQCVQDFHVVLQVIEDCHLGYGECRAPLFFEYVQANIAVAVNIRMEDFSFESNLQIFIRSAKHLRIIANKCSKRSEKTKNKSIHHFLFLPWEVWRDNQEGNGWLQRTHLQRRDYHLDRWWLLASGTYPQPQGLKTIRFKEESPICFGYDKSSIWNSLVQLPALHEVGGSLCKSLSSFKILFDAIKAVAVVFRWFKRKKGGNLRVYDTKGKVEVYLMVKFCAVVKFQRSTNSFRTDESGNSINSTKQVKKWQAKNHWIL